MLTIGRLAAQVDLTTNALRFYEREGLVRPASKTASGYRLYGDDQVARVRFLKQAQHCGFSLSEIAELLDLRSSSSACCDGVRKLAIEKKLQLEARIRAMKVMAQALDVLISSCPEQDGPRTGCPILQAMEDSAQQGGT